MAVAGPGTWRCGFWRGKLCYFCVFGARRRYTPWTEEIVGFAIGDCVGFVGGYSWVGVRVSDLGDLDWEFQVEGGVCDCGAGGVDGEVEMEGVDAGDETGVEAGDEDFVVFGEGNWDDYAGCVEGFVVVGGGWFGDAFGCG